MTEDQVRTILQTVVPSVDWTAVGADDNITDAGLDSLDKANVIMEIEQQAGVSIDDSKYDEMDSIADFVKVATA